MEKFTLKGRARAIRVEPAERERTIVRFPYSPEYVAKIRMIPGRRWHPDQKHWTVPHNDAALAHLLALFSDNPIDLDPALRPAHRRDGQDAPADPTIPHDSPHPPGLLDCVRLPWQSHLRPLLQIEGLPRHRARAGACQEPRDGARRGDRRVERTRPGHHDLLRAPA